MSRSQQLCASSILWAALLSQAACGQLGLEPVPGLASDTGAMAAEEPAGQAGAGAGGPYRGSP